MKKKICILIGFWFAGAVFIGSGALTGTVPFWQEKSISVVQAGKSSSSDDIQNEINEANKKKQSIEEEKKQLKSDIAAIETKKENVIEYIQGLDGKLTELSEKMEQNKADIVTAKSRIKTLRKEKKQAQSDKKKQYDTMSKRIKYLYENGNDGYLELLLGADSLSELFNRAEYVSKVTKYDNQMLDKYQGICDKIEKSQTQLEQKLAELTDLKESLSVEKDSVNLLMDKKNEELNKYQDLMNDKNSQLSSKDNLLSQQEDMLEKLMEVQRKKVEEEAKNQEAAAKKEEKSTNKKNDNTKSNSKSSKNTTTQNNTNNNTSNNTVSHSGYGWPLSTSGRISSYFGYRDAPTAGASTFHKGIDISVPVGTSVLATKSGTVVTSTYSSSAGNYIAIYHGNGVYSYYMHCSSLLVGTGTKVSKGQKVALSGNTGISTGPHLHFAIYAGGSYVNPLNYVSR